MVPELFGAVDRVMIGQGKQGHAPLPKQRIDLFGITIAFSAKLADKGSRTGSRKVRVDMHIALHDLHIKFTALHADDMRAKV